MTEPNIEDVQKALDKLQATIKRGYMNGLYLLVLNVIGLAAGIYFGTENAPKISISVVTLLFGIGAAGVLLCYGCLFASQFLVKHASPPSDVKEQARAGFMFMMNTTLTIYMAGVVAVVIAAFAGAAAVGLSIYFRH